MKLKTKEGWLTRYGLAYGYVEKSERSSIDSGMSIHETIYLEMEQSGLIRVCAFRREDGIYRGCVFDSSYESIKDARRVYKSLCGKANATYRIS